MMIKRFFAILLALLMAASLAGCQLALEDMGDGDGGERLIGVLVTTEHLDLFDFEGYVNDNLKSFSGGSGGEIKMDGNTAQYQGRLYAEYREEVLTSDETGEEITTGEYVFETVSGIPYFAATYSSGAESYVGTNSDEAVSDGHIEVFYGDHEERISLESTIYVYPGFAGKVFYMNPVYQSADGSVYAMTGSGYMANETWAEGEMYSQMFNEVTSITENGESTTYTTKVKTSVVTMFVPEQIVVLQMDKDSNVVLRDAFEPENVPETLTTEPETAYILLETHKTDMEGNPVVTREMFLQTDESLTSYRCREDGVCVQQWTELIWG